MPAVRMPTSASMEPNVYAILENTIMTWLIDQVQDPGVCDDLLDSGCDHHHVVVICNLGTELSDSEQHLAVLRCQEWGFRDISITPLAGYPQTVAVAFAVSRRTISMLRIRHAA